MEIAPDLQFKHYTVAEAQMPVEALMSIPDMKLETVEICCDLERHVFYAAHTDPEVGAGAAGDALVRADRVDLVRPGQRRAHELRVARNRGHARSQPGPSTRGLTPASGDQPGPSVAVPSRV